MEKHLPFSGLLVSAGGALPGIEPELADVVKALVHLVGEEEGPPESLRVATSPRGIFVDFGAIPSKFESDTALRDCRLVADLLEQKPDEIAHLVRAVTAAARGEGDGAAAVDMLNRIGFTEEAFAASRGGFIWLLVVLAVGASGCAHLKPYVKPDKKPGQK